MSDLKGFCHDLWANRKAESYLEGKADNPLSDVFHRQDGVDKLGCGLAHASGAAAGAEASSFAAEGDKVFEVAGLALGPQKAMGQDPALQVILELIDHEIWQGVACVLLNLGQEGEPVVLDDFIEDRFFGLVPRVCVD